MARNFQNIIETILGPLPAGAVIGPNEVRLRDRLERAIDRGAEVDVSWSADLPRSREDRAAAALVVLDTDLMPNGSAAARAAAPAALAA